MPYLILQRDFPWKKLSTGVETLYAIPLHRPVWCDAALPRRTTEPSRLPQGGRGAAETKARWRTRFCVR